MRLTSYVPKSLHSKIQVPITFIGRIDMGKRVYTIIRDFYSRLLVKNNIPLHTQVSDLIMRF